MKEREGVRGVNSNSGEGDGSEFSGVESDKLSED